MATDFTTNALAFVGTNSVVQNYALNSTPRFILTGAYDYIVGDSYKERVGFAPIGSIRQMPTIDDYVVGAYPVDVYSFEVEKNVYDNADEVPIAPGLTDNARKRKAINIYQSCINSGMVKTMQMMKRWITSDVQQVARTIELYTLQNLFGTITMNLGSGSVSRTWEQRPGYVAGVDLDYTSIPTTSGKVEEILRVIEANKSSLALNTGITGKVIVTLPDEVASLLKTYLTSQGRFLGAVVETPGIVFLQSKGMWFLDADTLIMPFNKTDMNSSGDPINYECGMFYQGAISFAYSDGASIYPTYAKNINMAVEDVMTRFNLSTSSLSTASISNVYWNELAEKLGQDYTAYNPNQLASLIGFMIFNQDATVQGSDSWQIGINFGIAIGQGGLARKFLWNSGTPVTFSTSEEKAAFMATHPNYHPDTFDSITRNAIRKEERLKKAKEAKFLNSEEFKTMKTYIENLERKLSSAKQK